MKGLRRVFCALYFIGILAFVLGLSLALSGCSIVPTGKQVWNPFTWFSGRALDSKAAAQKKEEKAEASLDAKHTEAFHAAHAEFYKANLALAAAEQSPEVVLSGRFLRGGLGLLDQVDPLTAAETASLFALVRELRSGDATRVAKAEATQAAVEQRNGQLSQEISRLEDALVQARANLRSKADALDAAFKRENELADTLRNQRFILWGAVGGVVILSALCLYLRMGLGSVGSGLAGLHKLIGQDNASKVITQLDANTDWLHQIIVGAGRKKADAARAETLSDTNHSA